MKSSEPFARSSELLMKSSGLFKRPQKMLFNIIIVHIKNTAMTSYKKAKLIRGTKAIKKEMGCAN
jgi:hypothetical protein